MKKLKIYIGYDPRDDLAFRACVASLHQHSSMPLDIIPLKDHELRRMGIFHRPYSVDARGQKIDDSDGKPFSTDFSFSRFAVSMIEQGSDPVLFVDADVLFMDDPANLFDEFDPSKAVQVVQHQYEPDEETKFDGMRQERYFRKNWSSVMLINPRLCNISSFQLNRETGSYLHGLFWVADRLIGKLDPKWNKLEGWDDIEMKKGGDLGILHFTRGTPDIVDYELPYSELWWNMLESWKPDMNRNGITYGNKPHK